MVARLTVMVEEVAVTTASAASDSVVVDVVADVGFSVGVDCTLLPFAPHGIVGDIVNCGFAKGVGSWFQEKVVVVTMSMVCDMVAG